MMSVYFFLSFFLFIFIHFFLLQFLVINTLDPYPDPDSLKMMDPQHCRQMIGFFCSSIPVPIQFLLSEWTLTAKLCVPV
jgi:hypothetical protein